MNRLAWLLGSGALVAWGFAGALGGCGSSDATVADVDGGEAGNGTSGGTSGATSGGTSGATSGGTSGTPADGGGGTDGATNEGGGGEAGLTSTPDKVPCANGMQCTTPAEVCCITGVGDGGCQAAGTTCAGGKIRCDEKADCTGTDICCGGLGGAGGGGGTQCKTGACSMGQVQVCKTNAECTGGTCYVNTCPSFGGGAPTVVDSCTKLPAPCTQ